MSTNANAIESPPAALIKVTQEDYKLFQEFKVLRDFFSGEELFRKIFESVKRDQMKENGVIIS